MRVRDTIRSLLILAVTAAPALAAAPADDAQKLAALQVTLQTRFPEIAIVDVKPAPVAGWYEVFTGDGIAYSDAAGDHILVGQLMDTKTHRNLTAQRMDERNAIDFSTLPMDKAIKVVKGKGTRQIAVFSDPDCPFCQKLEHELASVDDVTVHIFLYPLTMLHPDARNKAHTIWCAKDRSQAWTHWMMDRKLPEGASCNADPIDNLQELGEKLRISSTPTIFLSNGRRIGSSIPAAQVEALLKDPKAALNANPAEASGG